MSNHSGLALMEIEMGRQCADALQTLNDPGGAVSEIVGSLKQTGRLILYAMGGSQHVNRIVEPLYRELGIDARSMIASEQLLAPMPDVARTALIASQSGESGEIKQLLATPVGQEQRFGLTLEANSTLARSVRGSIVAAGGTEHAFAATRSIVLTLAMHAAVLEALGASQGALKAVLAEDRAPDMNAVADYVKACDVFVFAGWHVMQGTAESAALSMMELARVPAIGFEGGQFRHGPFEFLRPGLAITLLRSSGPDKALAAPVAETAVQAGCSVVLLDTSGEPAPVGCQHVVLPTNQGLAASVSVILALQRLNISLAKHHIPNGIGTPRFTSKVTA